jgi:hypothetical protein
MDGRRQHEDKENFKVPFAFVPQDIDHLTLMESLWNGFQYCEQYRMTAKTRVLQFNTGFE